MGGGVSTRGSLTVVEHMSPKALECFITFKNLSACPSIVPNSVRTHNLDSLLSKWSRLVKISYQIAAQCNIYRLCFQSFLCSSKSFPIPSECTIYRLCFHFFLCNSTSLQIQSECTIYHPCFHFFPYSSKF